MPTTARIPVAWIAGCSAGYWPAGNDSGWKSRPQTPACAWLSSPPRSGDACLAANCPSARKHQQRSGFFCTLACFIQSVSSCICQGLTLGFNPLPHQGLELVSTACWTRCSTHSATPQPRCNSQTRAGTTSAGLLLPQLIRQRERRKTEILSYLLTQAQKMENCEQRRWRWQTCRGLDTGPQCWPRRLSRESSLTNEAGVLWPAPCMELSLLCQWQRYQPEKGGLERKNGLRWHKWVHYKIKTLPKMKNV